MNRYRKFFVFYFVKFEKEKKIKKFNNNNFFIYLFLKIINNPNINNLFSNWNVLSLFIMSIMIQFCKKCIDLLVVFI